MSEAVSKSLMPEVYASDIDLSMRIDRKHLVGTMFQYSEQNN